MIKVVESGLHCKKLILSIHIITFFYLFFSIFSRVKGAKSEQKPKKRKIKDGETEMTAANGKNDSKKFLV